MLLRFLPVMLAASLLPAAEYPASKHGGTYMFNYYLPQLFVGGELRILAFQDTAVVLGGHVGMMF